MASESTKNDTGITIRRLNIADEDALARLAELDSATAPAGPLVGAEVNGRLAAAASISTGHVVADPFVRTDELRSLLEVRIAQLRGGERHSRRRFPRRRSRAALAGSPPEAGGKLLTLPVRLS